MIQRAEGMSGRKSVITFNYKYTYVYSSLDRDVARERLF